MRRRGSAAAWKAREGCPGVKVANTNSGTANEHIIYLDVTAGVYGVTQQMATSAREPGGARCIRAVVSCSRNQITGLFLSLRAQISSPRHIILPSLLCCDAGQISLIHHSLNVCDKDRLPTSSTNNFSRSLVNIEINPSWISDGVCWPIVLGIIFLTSFSTSGNSEI